MTGQETVWDRLKFLMGFSGKNSQALAEVESDSRTPGGVTAGSPEVLVLDVSGSMLEDDYKPTRLDGAKAASCAFLKKLQRARPKSMAALISFGSKGKIEYHPVSVGKGLAHIEARVRGLKGDGCTNMASGLRLAARIIGKCPGARAPRVLLLTDGHANEGGDPEPVAVRLKQHGVQLDIIGIGGSPQEVNEKQLKRMASVVDRRRRYWFIKSVPMLVKKFEALALREVK